MGEGAQEGWPIQRVMHIKWGSCSAWYPHPLLTGSPTADRATNRPYGVGLCCTLTWEMSLAGGGGGKLTGKVGTLSGVSRN